MGNRKTEVPLHLQRQIEAADSDSTSGYQNVESFVDALPDDLPEKCPICNSSLSPAAVYVTEDSESFATRLVCHGSHGDFVATYIYDIDDGELYLESETEPETITGD